MALLWIDGFDNYGESTGVAPSPANVVARKYPIVAYESYMDVETGRFSGYALQLQHGNCVLGSGPLTTNNTMVIGVAAKFKAEWDDAIIFAMFDGATTGVNAYMTSSGEIAVRRGSTVLGTTSGLSLSVGAWFHVELKVVCSNSGSYELRVNGQNVLSASGVDTQAGSNEYHDSFKLIGVTSSNDAAIVLDDLYCLDGSGSSNNNFLGNMRVATIRPSAAGGSSDFTPVGDANNYGAVDDSVSDDDTTYVSSETSTEKDLYEYTNPSGYSPISIAGICVCTDCRETDATNYTVKTVCLSNVTEDADAGQVVGSENYVTRKRILETDPDTDAAWDEAGIIAAQFGIEVA